MRGVLVALTTAALLSTAVPSSAADAPKPREAAAPEVADGTTVSLEYTLSDDKGGQIESNKGGEPLVYAHGKHQIIPGLEKALAGLHAGQEKKVTVPPEEAYGKVDEKAFVEIEKEKIPAEALQVGTILRAQSPDGQARPVRLSEIKEKTVVVDFNHPMAGKTLVFQVKVLDVKKAEATTAPVAPLED